MYLVKNTYNKSRGIFLWWKKCLWHTDIENNGGSAVQEIWYYNITAWSNGGPLV